MNKWSGFVVGQFIGGQAFFWGIALCLLGCSAKCFFSQARYQSIARVAILAGVVIVVSSAAPFSFWVYGLFFVLLGLAAFRPAEGRWRNRKADCVLLLLVLVTGLLMVRTELLHSTAPKIPIATNDTLYVIGDSLSIGADPPGKSWPELLGDLANIEVRNFSFGGAKVASSVDSALHIQQDNALVILELGGNDLLGGTSISEFRKNLEELLVLVCGPQRRVAMIELPLPPFYNRFGRVQRDLAKAHGVTLIPKRYLARIICMPGATVDGLHLSNTGHILFARELFEMFNHAE